MTGFAYFLNLALFANAAASFCVEFFWQAKVIFKIYEGAEWDGAFLPWKALRNEDSPQNRIGHFIAGQLYPELRRKWLKAVAYVVISYALVFLSAAFV